MRYKVLLKQGWKLHEIDEMDIHFYLELEQEELKLQEPSKAPVKMGYIDDIF